MLTMQAFYDRLFATPETASALWARLARLTQARRGQLAALDLGWYWW